MESPKDGIKKLITFPISYGPENIRDFSIIGINYVHIGELQISGNFEEEKINFRLKIFDNEEKIKLEIYGKEAQDLWIWIMVNCKNGPWK